MSKNYRTIGVYVCWRCRIFSDIALWLLDRIYWMSTSFYVDIMSELAPTGLVRPELALIKRQKLVACRDTVPSVHGRSANPSLNVKARLSNHQRNLSLDFRWVTKISTYTQILVANNITFQTFVLLLGFTQIFIVLHLHLTFICNNLTLWINWVKYRIFKADELYWLVDDIFGRILYEILG